MHRMDTGGLDGELLMRAQLFQGHLVGCPPYEALYDGRGRLSGLDRVTLDQGEAARLDGLRRVYKGNYIDDSL